MLSVIADAILSLSIITEDISGEIHKHLQQFNIIAAFFTSVA